MSHKPSSTIPLRLEACASMVPDNHALPESEKGVISNVNALALTQWPKDASGIAEVACYHVTIVPISAGAGVGFSSSLADARASSHAANSLS
jgi:hypothetical protein